jgi:putative transport protein
LGLDLSDVDGPRSTTTSRRIRGHLPRRRDGAAWSVAARAKLLRVDLAEECRKLEEQCRAARSTGVARRERVRAYAVDPGSHSWSGVGDLEASARGREFVEQIRARQIVASREHAPGNGDVGGGPRTTLVEVLEAPARLREVDDRELLDLPSDVVDVVVTSKEIDGGRSPISRGQVSRGVFLRRITRPAPRRHAARHVVQRGDVLTIADPPRARRVAEASGWRIA